MAINLPDLELRLLAHRHLLTTLVASSREAIGEALYKNADALERDVGESAAALDRISIYRDELDHILGTARAERSSQG